METINRDNIKTLLPGDKISTVNHGVIRNYKFLCQHPGEDSYFFTYRAGDAKRIYIPIEGLNCWFIGYDSEKLCTVAIDQLEKTIKATRKVYGKKEP